MDVYDYVAEADRKLQRFVYAHQWGYDAPKEDLVQVAKTGMELHRTLTDPEQQRAVAKRVDCTLLCLEDYDIALRNWSQREFLAWRVLELSPLRRPWARKSRAADPESRTRSCAVCGEQFTPPRAHAKTCSNACRQKAYRQRQGALRISGSDRAPRSQDALQIQGSEPGARSQDVLRIEGSEGEVPRTQEAIWAEIRAREEALAARHRRR